MRTTPPATIHGRGERGSRGWGPSGRNIAGSELGFELDCELGSESGTFIERIVPLTDIGKGRRRAVHSARA